MKLMPDRFKTPKIAHDLDGWHYPVLALPVILIWLLTAWLAFDYGRGRAGYDSGAVADRVDVFREEIKVLEKEREQLKRKIASLEREAQIYAEAEKKLKTSIMSQQDEKLALQKEVLFLRGVISGKSPKGLLRIQELQTLRDNTSGQYRLRFTIAQSLAGKKRVEGAMNISLVGVNRMGKDETLDFKNIATNEFQNKMGFWHFQKRDLAFKLPKGFKPVYWRVALKPTVKNYVELNERFDWNKK